MLQYKEYMGQALYQERGAMPVRSFCLSGGYNPKLLVLETLFSMNEQYFQGRGVDHLPLHYSSFLVQNIPMSL